MKYLQLIFDLIGDILKFFSGKKKEDEEANKKAEEDAKKREEEIDEKVNNADDGGLTDIAVDSGLVQRPVHPDGVNNRPDGASRVS